MEDKLKKLGLTDYETKAYLALISSGSVGGNKLSEVSKVPQGKIYLILSKLIEKGLVSQVNSKPKIFKAIDPEISLKALINEQKNNLDEIAQSVSAGIKEIKKLELNKQETDEKITILRGKK
ncbi:MAG: helix-turn-helix domain-containing protein, partial [archaeon]